MVILKINKIEISQYLNRLVELKSKIAPTKIVIAGFLTSVLLSSCSLIVPHRTAVALKPDDPTMNACYASAGVTHASTTPLPLCTAYGKAEGYRRAYFNAVRWNSGLRNSVSAITIPLIGLAVREGLEPTPSGTKIADFGVSTVVLYGWSTTLTSAPRQHVYLNGMQAMSCAMLEAQPLLSGNKELPNIQAQAATVVKARIALQLAIQSFADSSLTRPGDEVYVKALSDAHNSLQRAADFEVALTRASNRFLPLVEMIATQVSKNIVDTEPSPESLLSVLNGFGIQTQAVTQGLLIPKPSTAGTTQSGKIGTQKAITELNTLIIAIASLDSSLARIKISALSTSGIENCRPEGAINEFRVEPNTASVVIEAETSREFVVVNKISVPSAHLEGEKTANVKLEEILIRSGSFVVKITGLKATGDSGPTLVIKDGTGNQSKNISVSVVDKTPEAVPTQIDSTQKTTSKITTGLSADETAVLNTYGFSDEGTEEAVALKESIMVVQCLIGTKPDGVIGKNTRDAIKAYRKSTPITQSEIIDQPLIVELRDDLANKPKCKE